MGHTQAAKVRDDAPVQLLECGDVFFLYRPKVDTEDSKSVDDVQRLFFVLRPETAKEEEQEKQSSESGKEGVKKEKRKSSTEGNEKESEDDRSRDDKHEKPSERQKDKQTFSSDARKLGQDATSPGGKSSKRGQEGGHGSEKIVISDQALLRLIIVGKKTLPDVKKKSSRPIWGFVELVTTDPQDIKDALAAATRGHRRKPVARPVGEGAYCILSHASGRQSHTHFVYKRDLPEKGSKNKRQQALHIEDEAFYIIQIRNPEQPAPNNVGLGNKRRARFPAHLQGIIGSRRFVPADPPDFLNFEGCEFILIPASDNIEKELGVHLAHEHEEHQPCPDLPDILP
ncbi:hypothetical protein O6H91_02G153800 [Diphasiastrum complanatum]|uniref:Uncharacterized protein n=1 Tax=Diphasiastrum complanatum TaxID=34168 RepID=A0ACC2EM34_DIPCM|nr:hypothetical protein O6H91_02G153800 [Diphasiastrum complanatum]